MSRRREIFSQGSLANPLLAEGSGSVSTLSLLTYALSRLPPWHLPLLLLYSMSLVAIYELGLFPSEYMCKGGAAVAGTLSMVIGLLLSYRFSSAIAKWDQGRQVWTAVRTDIRDAIRMLSVLPPSASAAFQFNSSCGSPGGDGTAQLPLSPTLGSDSNSDLGVESIAPLANGDKSLAGSVSGATERQMAMVHERTQELAGAFVGFAFALQHHLLHTRPLPQPPLCDLLPRGYLSSLKRTEYRVRFAGSHAGPSSSTLDPFIIEPESDPSRPAFKRRGTGRPPSEKQGQDWNLRETAADGLEKLAGAVASATTGMGSDYELRLQLEQLNLPSTRAQAKTPPATPATPAKSNLTQPNPPNLPLALLRIMQGYVVGLAEIEVAVGGWSEAKRERALSIIKSLSSKLGEAEVLNSTPPPLPLTLHLSHLLVIYLAALPATVVPILGRWSVLVTLIAGWCFFGLEALTSEVGGVFGTNENHLPLERFTSAILHESLEISLAFRRAYHGRLVARTGPESAEAVQVAKRRSEEWTVAWS